MGWIFLVSKCRGLSAMAMAGLALKNTAVSFPGKKFTFVRLFWLWHSVSTYLTQTPQRL